MIAILLSIKPKWCVKMMNGDKTIEVRKGTALYKAIQKLIDKNGYADIYMYCTKDEELYKFSWNKTWYENFKHFIDMGCDQAHALDSDNLSGKVIFKFRCYLVEEINYDHDDREEWYATKTLNDRELEKQSCLTYEELDGYLRGKGTAIHISNLEIFDKPKELSEFRRTVFYIECENCPYTNDKFACEMFGNCHEYIPLTKAPQSWCYVEEPINETNS